MVYERLNKKKKKIVKIEIGQANYSENGLNTITFDISPKLPKVLELSYYGKGTTDIFQDKLTIKLNKLL